MAPSSVRSLNVVDASSSLGPSLSNVSAIGELINIVPHSWRSSIGNYLTTVYRVATKLCNVQNTIAQYDKHHAEGSFPASIKNAVKDPKIQFSKEFLGSEIGSLANNHLQSVIHSARKNLLEEAQKRKKEELATLQGLTHFHEINWKKLVLEVAERVGTTFNANPVVDQSGTQLSWKGTVPDDIKQDCKFLWTKGSTLHFKAVSLARAIADRSLVEKIKILNLKKDTDTAMRDADVESSTRDVVRDEMQTQLRLLKKELLQSMGKAKKPASQNNNKKKGGTNPSRVKKGPAKNKGKKNAKNR